MNAENEHRLIQQIYNKADLSIIQLTSIRIAKLIYQAIAWQILQETSCCKLFIKYYHILLFKINSAD